MTHRFIALLLLVGMPMITCAQYNPTLVGGGNFVTGGDAAMTSVSSGAAGGAASTVADAQCVCQMDPEIQTPPFCPELPCYDPLGVIGICAFPQFCLGLSYVVGAGVLAMGLSGGGLSGSSANDANNAVVQAFGGPQPLADSVASTLLGSTANVSGSSALLNSSSAASDANSAVSSLLSSLSGGLSGSTASRVAVSSTTVSTVATSVVTAAAPATVSSVLSTSMLNYSMPSDYGASSQTSPLSGATSVSSAGTAQSGVIVSTGSVPNQPQSVIGIATASLALVSKLIESVKSSLASAKDLLVAVGGLINKK